MDAVTIAALAGKQGSALAVTGRRDSTVKWSQWFLAGADAVIPTCAWHIA